MRQLVDEETPLTVDVALRLARLFGTVPEFWMNFQTHYDLETAEKKLSKDLEAIKPLPKQDAA
ncbi:addiction module antidote protein, HigA family [Fulvimarina manganoxydans]|uniref:Addiction module antidote protein, HigA family n=1 Tax=Fulvimarina manganoxydans TaxID=937218 RepID=A0A1W2DE04_9HYPH|nr:HigA family addiction module antitoxin [Fulvimarina manganoxydans]MEE2951451.1 HigA family addiction module antitoxin [Pseudomonadota bacterium]SMC95720.1 addiction module antidote protein, HigA family [Fulvimarina manganoxydans]